MTASTESMCFRSESLAVYSCIRASASSREGRAGMEGRHVAGEGNTETGLSMPRRRPIQKNTADEAEAQGGCAPFLREIHRRPDGDHGCFPFSVPVIRTLDTLRFDRPVTFFVGENSSGKSTLLEAIAAAAGLPSVGSADLDADVTIVAQRALAKALRLVWTRRTPRGFFLRAEDFFGFAKRLAVVRGEVLQRIPALG